MNILIKRLPVAVLLGGLLSLGACKSNKTTEETNNTETTHTETDTTKTETTNSDTNANKELLIGSWLDTSKSALHFTLMQDGTARSDNMKTLVYKQWRLEGNKLILTAETVGNGVSTEGETTYDIQTLTADKMVLRNGELISEYVKEKINGVRYLAKRIL